MLNAPCPTGTFTPTYNYDIENRLSTTGTYSYVYDGDGQRVKKCSSAGCTAGTLYWRDTSGEPLLEAGVGGTGTEEYVYFNGKRVARRDITGSVVHYCFADHLGSATVVTNATGTTPFDEDLDYYPYGGIVATSSDTVPQHYKFTGKERDSESGLDNFGARYSASSLGRFMSPDPKTISPLRMLDPQQWNRYAYTRNSPLIYVDPDGKELRIAIYYKNVDEALARRVGSLISGKFEKAGVKNVSVELHKGSPNSLTVLDYSLPGTQSTMLELRKGKDTTSILGSSIPESEGGHNWGGYSAIDVNSVRSATSSDSQLAQGLANEGTHEIAHDELPHADNPGSHEFMTGNGASDPQWLKDQNLTFSEHEAQVLQNSYNKPGEVDATPPKPQTPRPPCGSAMIDCPQ